jgi:hypothetical protein
MGMGVICGGVSNPSRFAQTQGQMILGLQRGESKCPRQPRAVLDSTEGKNTEQLLQLTSASVCSILEISVAPYPPSTFMGVPLSPFTFMGCTTTLHNVYHPHLIGPQAVGVTEPSFNFAGDVLFIG